MANTYTDMTMDQLRAEAEARGWTLDCGWWYGHGTPVYAVANGRESLAHALHLDDQSRAPSMPRGQGAGVDKDAAEEAARILGAADVVLLLRRLATARAVEHLRRERAELRAERDHLVDEIAKVTAAHDRLARTLAVEQGDESAAPEGWARTQVSAWLHQRPAGDWWSVRYVGRRDLFWVARVRALPPMAFETGRYPTALEAMEAAKEARNA